MAGKIYALHDGGDLTELHPTQYSNEDFFQSLIEKHPEILAGDQIDPEVPRKWLLVSREMGVPSEQEGNSQWFLDHLFIDQDAIPTFVEVKRSTDTRIRREVVAQMLDYAANATKYWPLELIQEAYEKNISEANSLSNLEIPPENEDTFWQSVSMNLRSGKIRLIFAADSIPASLQRIIEFLNSQMVDTEVLGLEIKQFLSADGLTTLVPHIIGRTSTAVDIKNINAKRWDEQSFMAHAAQVSGDEVAALCEKMLRFFESLGCYIWWGKGKISSSFIPVYVGGERRHQLCSIYTSTKNTTIEILFQHMKPPFNEKDYKMKMKVALEKIPGVRISNDRLNKRPNFLISCLSADNDFNTFANVIESYVKDIKAHESEQ